MEKASKLVHVSLLMRRGDTTNSLLLQQGERYPFLRGPVPLDWLTTAAKLPGRSLHVGVALWFWASLGNSRAVLLTNTAADLFGVDRNGKYRALDWLEHARLVTVERKVGRAPMVTHSGRGGRAVSCAIRSSWFQPRIVRFRDAPGYLGMDRNRFNAEVRPYLTELPIGTQGHRLRSP